MSSHQSSPLELLKIARKEYSEGGVRLLMIQIWRYLLLYSPFSNILKKVLGDPLHEKLKSCVTLGYWPNIRDPRTFNEKILHRKLYTNKNIFTQVEDKWLVREYVEERFGTEILPEVYCVTDEPDNIPFEDLPNQFVVKPTHGSGQSRVVTDTSNLDFQNLKSECSQWLSQKYPSTSNEYWYDDMKPRILIEEYIDENGQKAPIDYKFMVFHGEVKAIHVTMNRMSSSQTVRNFYDRDWNPIDVELYFPKGPGMKRPDQLDKMINIAESLGEPFDHIRVDLYAPNDDEVVFGEMTVAEGSGANRFKPEEYDFKLGEYW